MNDIKSSESVILSLQQQTLDRLHPCLSLVIEETADYLFSLSTSSRLDPANQNHCYDAFVTLQGQTKQVVTQICAVVEGRFVSLKERQRADLDKQPLQQETELTLLDLEVFEETLAIEKIVTASTTRFWIDLESLMFRLGTLLDIPAEAIKLPVSPYILCSAYR